MAGRLVPAAGSVPSPTAAPEARTPAALVLTRPALAASFRAGRLEVAGLRGGHGAVRMTVIDERGRILEALRVLTRPTAAGDGALRPFAATLRVPNPPRGTIWLEVVAYDEAGHAVAALTRSLAVVDRR